MTRQHILAEVRCRHVPWSRISALEVAANGKRYFAQSIPHSTMEEPVSGFSAHELNGGDAGQPLVAFSFFHRLCFSLLSDSAIF